MTILNKSAKVASIVYVLTYPIELGAIVYVPAEYVTNVGKVLYPASFVVNVTVFPSGSLYEGIV